MVRKLFCSSVVATLLMGLALGAYGETNQHLYVTSTPIEPDKCISAWLLKRYVDTEAVFSFIKKEEKPTAGILFDIPGSPYLRNHKMCAAECVVHIHKLSDKKAVAVAALARKLEIGYWCAEFSEQEKPLAKALMEIWKRDGDPRQDLKEGFRLLDNWNPFEPVKK